MCAGELWEYACKHRQQFVTKPCATRPLCGILTFPRGIQQDNGKCVECQERDRAEEQAKIEAARQKARREVYDAGGRAGPPPEPFVRR